jgi:hypothetical protein
LKFDDVPSSVNAKIAVTNIFVYINRFTLFSCIITVWPSRTPGYSPETPRDSSCRRSDSTPRYRLLWQHNPRGGWKQRSPEATAVDSTSTPKANNPAAILKFNLRILLPPFNICWFFRSLFLCRLIAGNVQISATS